jgi:chloramphenicol 3-O-phosphotransferase
VSISPEPSPGRIILVNGTSSSGKTTLVRGLQRALPDLWLEMGIDRFAYALPGRVAGEPTWPLLFRYVRPDGRTDGPFTIETTPLGQRFTSTAGGHTTSRSIPRS